MPTYVNGKETKMYVAIAKGLIKLFKGIISILLLIPVVVLLKVYLLKPFRYSVASQPDLYELYKSTKKELMNIISDVIEALLMIHIFLVFFTMAIAIIGFVIYGIIKLF